MPFLALSLFDARLAQVRDTALRLLGSHYRAEPVSLPPFPDQHGRRGAPRATLWASRVAPGRCALMAHQEDGWSTLTNLLATSLRTPTLQLRATDGDTERHVCDFVCWRNGQEIRRVSVIDDKPWRFHQRGEPLRSETPQQYGARRVRDRLTAASLARVAVSLGWPVIDPAFWQPEQAVVLLSE